MIVFLSKLARKSRTIIYHYVNTAPLTYTKTLRRQIAATDSSLTWLYTMFDIGFFELCLIGIIALLVIGPEKLPRVARTVGLWVGKAQGLVKTVKYEIDEQLRTEELKQSMQQATNSVKGQVSETIEDVEASFNDLRDELKSTPQENIGEPSITPDKKQNPSAD